MKQINYYKIHKNKTKRKLIFNKKIVSRIKKITGFELMFANFSKNHIFINEYGNQVNLDAKVIYFCEDGTIIGEAIY